MSAFAGKWTLRAPLPYFCISPKLGKFMNVCFILKADVQTEEIIGNKVANSASQIDFAE